VRSDRGSSSGSRPNFQSELAFKFSFERFNDYNRFYSLGDILNIPGFRIESTRPSTREGLDEAFACLLTGVGNGRAQDRAGAGAGDASCR
jgi:hypothetical protein